MKHSSEFINLVEAARKHIREVSVSEAFSSVKLGVQIIDVREDSEWSNNHVPGAKHIGRGILERDIIQTIPDKNTELILYCQGGYRSVLAALTLQNMGYKNVSSMFGGWKAWLAAELPKNT